MRQRHTVRRAHTSATGRTDAGAPTPATEPHAATMRSQFMALRRPPLGITQYAVTARIRPKHTKCFCTRRDKKKNNHKEDASNTYDQRRVCCLRGHLCPPWCPPWSPPGMPPLSAPFGVYTRSTCSTKTGPISRQQHSPRRRPAQEAALLPMRAQTRSLSTQAPRTKSTANSFFRSSTASTRHSSGVRFPPRRPSSQDQQRTRPSPVSSHPRLTQQLTQHWPQFKALRQHYACTRFEEKRQLHPPQKHKATVPASTLRVEMNGLEEQADTAKTCDLYWKPLSMQNTHKMPSEAGAHGQARRRHRDSRRGGARARRKAEGGRFRAPAHRRRCAWGSRVRNKQQRRPRGKNGVGPRAVF